MKKLFDAGYKGNFNSSIWKGYWMGWMTSAPICLWLAVLRWYLTYFNDKKTFQVKLYKSHEFQFLSFNIYVLFRLNIQFRSVLQDMIDTNVTFLKHRFELMLQVHKLNTCIQNSRCLRIVVLIQDDNIW